MSRTVMLQKETSLSSVAQTDVKTTDAVLYACKSQHVPIDVVLRRSGRVANFKCRHHRSDSPSTSTDATFSRVSLVGDTPIVRSVACQQCRPAHPAVSFLLFFPLEFSGFPSQNEHESTGRMPTTHVSATASTSCQGLRASSVEAPRVASQRRLPSRNLLTKPPRSVRSSRTFLLLLLPLLLLPTRNLYRTPKRTFSLLVVKRKRRRKKKGV